jgi:hypothetical protein
VTNPTTETDARPIDAPPDEEIGDIAATVSPRPYEELTDDLVGGVAATAAVEQAPTLEPPSEVLEAEAIGLWQSNKHVNSLFVTGAVRNSWMHIVSPSVWRKFAPASDSGVTAMTMLAAHARDRNRPVKYREEADGLVHEIYVW